MSTVTLREAVPADAECLARWENLDGYPEVTAADMLRFINLRQTLLRNNQQRFVIVNEGEATGTVDLTNLTADGLGAFLSIYIDENHRARRIGSEALRLAIRHAISLGLKRLAAIIKNSNIASQSLFTSAGFVPVAPFHADPEATVWMLEIAVRHVENPT